MDLHQNAVGLKNDHYITIHYLSSKKCVKISLRKLKK